MQGGIRSIESLKKWFFAVNSPFYTLSYLGQANHVILRNTAVEDMNEAWAMLETQVLAQSEYGRAQMHLITYKKQGGANNPEGRTNIDMWPTGSTSQVHGIGSIQVAGIDESKVQGLISAAREKWELEKRLEDLEAQIENPGDWTQKFIDGFERISATPIGQLLAAKLLGADFKLPAAQVAGHPDTDDEEHDTFEQDIAATARMLGVDDIVLARKMRELVEQNPAVAKQLLQ